MADTTKTELRVEPLREGWLVRGTTDYQDALHAVSLYPEAPADAPAGWRAYPVTGWCAGHFRKVPGQWSDFWLSKADGPGRGAFPAVILYTNGRTG